MSREHSDFAFYEALKAHSNDPEFIAQHKAVLALAKERLIIVYHNPPLPVRVTSQEVSPRASGRPVAAACVSRIRLTNTLGGHIPRFSACILQLPTALNLKVPESKWQKTAGKAPFQSTTPPGITEDGPTRPGRSPI
jgi:hypothetical protein